MAFHRSGEPEWSVQEADWSAFDDGLEIDDEAFAKAIQAGRSTEAQSHW